MAAKFDDEIICLWTIVYDNDIDRVYAFTEHQRVIAAVIGSIRSYIGDVTDENVASFEAMLAKIENKLRESEKCAWIPIKFINLTISIYRWELDNTNQMHRILSNCYNQVDEQTRLEIGKLFVKSIPAD